MCFPSFPLPKGHSSSSSSSSIVKEPSSHSLPVLFFFSQKKTLFSCNSKIDQRERQRERGIKKDHSCPPLLIDWLIDWILYSTCSAFFLSHQPLLLLLSRVTHSSPYILVVNYIYPLGSGRAWFHPDWLLLYLSSLPPSCSPSLHSSRANRSTLVRTINISSSSAVISIFRTRNHASSVRFHQPP